MRAHRVENRRTGRVYWYAWRGGPPLWNGPASDEDLAQIAVLYDEEVNCLAARGTVDRLVVDFLRSPEFKALAPSTRTLYRDFLDRLRTRAGELSLDEFNGTEGRARIREWRNAVTPRTADQVRTVVGALATWARANDFAGRDFAPTADMKTLYSAPPQDAWTRADIDKAMTGLPPHLSRVVALALNTGLRRADLCAITWAAVDTAAGVIRWHTSKGRKRRRLAVIDLTPALRMTLERCPQGDAVTILTNAHGRPWTPSGLSSSLDKALQAIGVDGTLHGLRRTAATHLAAQGFSSRDIARRLGWSEAEAEKMTAVYVDEERKRDER